MVAIGLTASANVLQGLLLSLPCLYYFLCLGMALLWGLSPPQRLESLPPRVLRATAQLQALHSPIMGMFAPWWQE